MVENHPGAGLGAGGVDRGVPGDRARADRAAEGFAPEVRQGGGSAESMVRAAKLRPMVVVMMVSFR